MILLVASTTGYQTEMFRAAAERLGLEVRLATDRCHVLADPWGDGAVAVRFDDPGSAAEAVAGMGVTGLVALGDRPAEVAAAMAGRLGIRYNSAESVAACRSKWIARGRFGEAGLPVPEYFRVGFGEMEEAAERAGYPCVLKPLGLSASRGVIRVDSAAEFRVAFRRIRALLERPEVASAGGELGKFIQVEAFIPGSEHALEGILVGGELRVVALFDKPDPLDGPFFEETIYVTPSRLGAEVQGAIRETVGRAVRALGLTEGPVHAEMRVNEAGVWMLEVAARPIGGLCARVLPRLPEWIVRHASGAELPENILENEARGVMMIPIPKGGIYAGAEGLESAQSVAGIEDIVITAKLGQRLVPLPEGASYLGFVFGNEATPAKVEAALREAHRRVRFSILEALPVV